MYKWITLLYTGKQNNIVNKEYLIKKKLTVLFFQHLKNIMLLLLPIFVSDGNQQSFKLLSPVVYVLFLSVVESFFLFCLFSACW